MLAMKKKNSKSQKIQNFLPQLGDLSTLQYIGKSVQTDYGASSFHKMFGSSHNNY